MTKYVNKSYRFKLSVSFALVFQIFSAGTLFADSSAISPVPDMSKTMGVMDIPEKIEQSISGNQPGERYVCPMHPEEVSHKSGSCSKCGMFLVKQDIDGDDPESMTGSMPAMQIDHQHAEQNEVYACPMHPQESSDKPGSCSKCGMFLVKKIVDDNSSKIMPGLMPVMDNKISAPSAIYACPMHPEETGNKPGSCSKCGMFLVAQKMDGMDSSDTGNNHQTAHDADMKPATMPSAAMQHDKTQMKKQARPARYWETEEAETTQQMQHNNSTNNEPAAQRMQPALPTISGAIDHVMPSTTDEHATKHLDPTYICPMHPQIMQHEPGGNCPICGMNLVAKEIATSAGDTPQVFLPAAVIQNMGVRTQKVQRKAIDKKIRTQGRVTADDERLMSIHSRTGGWIEILHLVTEGDRVERKDELLDFYSPWINQVQLDYISALEEYDLTSFDPSNKVELGAKVDSLRNSLRLLNVMDMDIMRIRNSRKVQNTIQLLAPQGGIITRLNINEGSYVEPYESMFTIVDLSQVWVMVDIYEHQAPWVRKGNKVKISAPAIPARSWEGVIDFIYPQVNAKSRTLRARIVVPNPDEALLLNMFVKVDITANTNKHAVLTVPREAVIITGERESVIKVLEKGHFQPVEVTTGKRGEGRVEILSGLQEGDDIVVSGQFLIDSESSLQASFLRMSE